MISICVEKKKVFLLGQTLLLEKALFPIKLVKKIISTFASKIRFHNKKMLQAKR